ncbi:hypothetical protein F2Q69_00045381 [Brassica cretica]|uniref:Transcription repressor n=2 Tax=Brassica cretica TaxID=69181 RepID=A0ABQ7CNF4_BRACR|nr:hypothetical protein F2Q69_00045381 [Brassica cretica]KAF3560867.1 hypothetical protein DY000_02019605 [Brassica cretica]
MSSSQCSSSSSQKSSSVKLKSLIQILIITQVCRLIRKISRASSILVRVLRKKQYNLLSMSCSFYPKRASKKQKNNIFFGSFRLHYNFCSSHVVPVSAPHSTESMDDDDDIQETSQLSSYLNQLEDDKAKDGKEEEEGKEMKMMNEIDKLADMFIAYSHEKFMLEKVDSYRRFQEMLKTSS